MEEKRREGKTQIEAQGCCCLEQRKHRGNLAAGQFREGSRQKGVGLECTFFQSDRGSTVQSKFYFPIAKVMVSEICTACLGSMTERFGALSMCM